MNDATQILQLIKTSVQETAPGATVILYGSYARGDYNEESDIDLLILLDCEKITRDEKIKITYPLYDIELNVGVIISPKVRSKKIWETRYTASSFHRNVTREGIVL